MMSSFIVCLAIETDINRDFSTAHCWCLSGDSREIHVYGKRQTSDESWEFLRLENKQIKKCPEQFLRIKLAWNYLFLSRSNKQ